MSLELNRIYLGDCLEVMRDIDDHSVDMILTDLPYGMVQSLKWDSIIPFDKLWEQFERIIKDNGAIVLTASQPFTSKLVMSNLNLFKYEWIWVKDKPSNFVNANKMPMKYHENICVFYRKLPIYNKQMQEREGGGKSRYKYKVDYSHHKSNHVNIQGDACVYYDPDLKNPSSVQKFSTGRMQDNIHPTQKPVSLFEYLIRTYSNEGDVVLDSCIGSGTTAIACLNINRKFIGIEKEEKYFDMSVDRIIKWLEENNKSLDDL